MAETDKRFHVAVFNDNTVRFIDYEGVNDLISISFKEHSDAIDCRDALMYQCDLMNELYEENQQLKAQLTADVEEGVCNICKYHYLVKDDELGYYNSRCKKGHYECARGSLRYCKDFGKVILND